MNGRQRRKLFAGAGIFSMLLGALMVVVPAGAGAVVWDGSEGQPQLDQGGNLWCSRLSSAYVLSGKDETTGNATSGTIDDPGFLVDWQLVLNDEGDADNQISFTVKEGSHPVSAIIVKTGNVGVEQSAGALVYEEYDPAIQPGAPAQLIDYPASAISNIQACGIREEPEEPTITIVKAAVPGTQIPAGTEFDFFGPWENKFSLEVGESRTDAMSGDMYSYWYTEVQDDDYPLAYVECGELTFTDRDPEEFQIYEVAMIDGVWNWETGRIEGVQIFPGEEDVTCTFFNEGDTPPPPPSGGGGTPPVDVLPEPEVVAPASLTVVKVVDGDEVAIPETWIVEIDIDGGNSTDAVLTETTTSVTQAELDPGTYSLRELSFDDGELTAISCLADGIEVAIPAGTGLLADGVTVDLQSGDDVTCTFTNTYLAQEVLPEPPVENIVPPAPQVQPAAEVKGDVVTRTLPRTGNESRDLAGFGAGLLLLGIGLVLTSRGRYARVG